MQGPLETAGGNPLWQSFPKLLTSEEVGVERTAMSRKEFSRGSILARVAAGTLTLTEAVPLLGVSFRQAKRLWQRYRRRGTAALVHGNVGRRSNHAHAAAERVQVLTLIRTPLRSSGPRARRRKAGSSAATGRSRTGW